MFGSFVVVLTAFKEFKLEVKYESIFEEKPQNINLFWVIDIT
jgi:hypothetical protein